MSNLDTIATFTEDSLPDLDVVVRASLEFFAEHTIPRFSLGTSTRPLVVGSGNALPTGMIMFRDVDALFADEATMLHILARSPAIDALYLISASGGKDAITLAREATKRDFPVYLITANDEAPAAQYIADERIFVTPHIREPYTYNTSTYLGMILSTTGEEPSLIQEHIETAVLPMLSSELDIFGTFTFVVKPEFEALRAMFQTKFDELFGPMLHGRVFTETELKHAKTVVPSATECFIQFGIDYDTFGTPESRVVIPLPENCGPGAMLAIGYAVIGRIQRENPAYFKENVARYTEQASAFFEQHISVIVE